MRSRIASASILILAASAFVAACATPPAPPVEPPAPPLHSRSLPKYPRPPPPVLELIKPKEPELFPAAAGADLEPLPPPVGDLWERIVEGYAIPTSRARWSRNGSSGTPRGPITSRAWWSAAAATSTTS